jgi:hypothetical protein
VPTVANGGAARWANPAADVITQPASSAQTTEGFAVTHIQQAASVRERGISFALRQGSLFIDRGISGDRLSGMEVVLFDLSGKVVMRWTIDRAIHTGAVIGMKLPKLKAGMYIVQITCATNRLSGSMLIR